jgi:four helix bundle protein
MAFKFENLNIWQRALDLSVLVHEVTLKFPKEELYVLTSQMKRAADSVALNIAEGSTGQTNPEFRRFLGIALRSAIEVVACTQIAQRRKIISEEDIKTINQLCEELVAKISALRKKL